MKIKTFLAANDVIINNKQFIIQKNLNFLFFLNLGKILNKLIKFINKKK